MKNLLFISFLFPVALFGQYIGNDTLTDLPFSVVHYQDFNTNVNGWATFNGGAIASNAGNMRVTNGSSGSKGAILNDYTNEASTRYRLVMKIDSLSAGATGLVIASQWSTRVDTMFGAGWHNVQFVTDASPGGFGNKLVVYPLSAGVDTAYIGFVEYAKINTHRDIYSRTEVDDTINTRLHEVGTIYGNGFDVDIDGISVFSFTGPSNPTNGTYLAVLPASGDVVCFGYGEFLDTQAFRVDIDITIVDNPILLRSVWGLSNGSPIITISESGKYSFNMFRRGPQASLELDGLCAYSSTGATLQVNDIKISAIQYNVADHMAEIRLGSNATVVNGQNPLANELSDGSIAIGYSSYVDGEGIAIGDSARAGLDATYGTAGGDDMLAIGHRAKSYGWRNTAIGARSHAAGQSSTAIGTGAVALPSHSVALGRGAFMGLYNGETANSFLTDAQVIYASNGWAHRFDTPLSGIDIGEDLTPSTVEVKYYAQDAYDSRASASDFNVAAGHIGIYSGRGTGTGEGGEVRFYTAPQQGVGGNVKNTPVLSAKFDSDASLSDGTDLWLLDRSDDTMKRVQLKTPTGSGQNKIIGFSRLYIQ